MLLTLCSCSSLIIQQGFRSQVTEAVVQAKQLHARRIHQDPGGDPGLADTILKYSSTYPLVN